MNLLFSMNHHPLHRSIRRLFLVSLALTFLPSASAQQTNVPQTLHYQGRVLQDGAPFTGTGHFVFAMFSNDSVIWNNWQGREAGVTLDPGSEPATTKMINPAATPLPLEVRNGLFSAILGKGGEVNQPIDSGVFFDADSNPQRARPGMKLGVWFSQSADGPFARLAPDIQFASVPYAMVAGVAESIKERSVTMESLAADLAESISPALPWQIEPVVTSTKSSGVLPKLAFDAEGSPIVGHRASSNSVSVARKTPNGWEDEVVYSGSVNEAAIFAKGENQYIILIRVGTEAMVLSHDGSTWNESTRLQDVGSIGISAARMLASGAVGLAYTTNTSPQSVHLGMWHPATGWLSEVIKANSYGYRVALSQDIDGTIYAVFAEDRGYPDPFEPPVRVLVLAAKSPADVWTLDDVPTGTNANLNFSAGVETDAQGNPVILAGMGQIDTWMTLASKKDGIWYQQPLDLFRPGSGGALRFTTNGHPTTVYSARASSGGGSVLRYGQWIGGHWVTEVVDIRSGFGEIREFDYALDPNGIPHIAYFDPNSQTVMLAKKVR